MKLVNIIIPTFNEEQRLPETLTAYANFIPKLKGKYNVRLYIVDDGSTDKSKTIAQELILKQNITGEILSYKENKGKGHAVKTGMLNSRKADYYYLADADLSSSWDVLDNFLNQIEVTNFHAIIGSRAKEESKVETSYFRYSLGRLAAFIIRIVLNLHIRDTQCGYKLFSKEALQAFRLQKVAKWGFDFEILYILKLLKLNVLEVGIKWKNKGGSSMKYSNYFSTLKQLIVVRLRKNEIKKAINGQEETKINSPSAKSTQRT